MKILFDHPNPFLLAHGGFQIQIEQTKAALEEIGVEVEYLRWWDEKQQGNIIHYFGRPTGSYIDFCHQKGLKVVVAELHTGLGSRSSGARLAQKQIMRASRMLLPAVFTAKLAWDAYKKADAFVALTPWEARLMREMFDARPDKIHVVPNGVETAFFLENPTLEKEFGTFLVCTATITERKRVLELSQAAIAAKTPIWIIGKPYSPSDPYYRDFLRLQEANPALIRYEGSISDRARLAHIYANSRGFVLLSAMESLSLSALEAAASGCPLLLSQLPWASSSFGKHASYCPLADTGQTAEILKSFYQKTPSLNKSFQPLTWREVGLQLRSLYESLPR